MNFFNIDFEATCFRNNPPPHFFSEIIEVGGVILDTKRTACLDPIQAGCSFSTPYRYFLNPQITRNFTVLLILQSLVCQNIIYTFIYNIITVVDVGGFLHDWRSTTNLLFKRDTTKAAAILTS